MKTFILVLLALSVGSGVGGTVVYFLFNPINYSTEDITKAFKEIAIGQNSKKNWTQIYKFQCESSSDDRAKLVESSLAIMDELPLFFYKSYINGEDKALNILDDIFTIEVSRLGENYKNPKKIFNIVYNSLKYIKDQVPKNEDKHEVFVSHVQVKLEQWEKYHLLAKGSDELNPLILEKAKQARSELDKYEFEVFGVVETKEKAISIAEKVMTDIFDDQVSLKKPLQAKLFENEWAVTSSKSLLDGDKKRPVIIIDSNIGQIVGATVLDD